MSEQTPQTRRQDAQERLLSVEMFWGIGLGAWQTSILPAVEPVAAEDEEGARYVRFTDHGDGNYSVDFDPAVPPTE